MVCKFCQGSGKLGFQQETCWYCQGKGFIKDVNEENKQVCYQCHGECEEIYQVRVIDEKGNETYEKVCSQGCGITLQQKLYKLHQGRADKMKHQHFQRLK